MLSRARRSPAEAVPGAARRPATILAAAIVVQAMTAPGQTVGVSVFVDHLVTDLELSRSAVSGAYLIGTLSGAASMTTAGRLIDRHGVRRAITAFAVGFGAVLMAMGAVTGFVTLMVGFAITRMLGQGALTLAASTTVAVWFDRNRGTAMGLKTALGGGAMSLVPIGASAAIPMFGWRTTWVLLGIAVLAVVVPIGHVVVRDPPHRTQPGTEPDRSDVGSPDAWTLATAMRTMRFWVVVSGVSLSAMISTALVFHQITLLGDRGLSATQAAANFLPQTLAAAGGALMVGRIADRTSAHLLLPLSILFIGAAPALLLTVSGPGWLVVVYATALGASGGIVRTIEGTALPRWFGTRYIGEIRGLVMAVSVGASALGPFVLAAGHDLAGSYMPVLAGFIAAPALAAAVASRAARR